MQDVLVAGGGAAGLVAAIGFARKGLKTHVIGVPDAPRDDARSAALFEASLAFMDSIGVGVALREAGAPLRAIRIIDITGALVRAPTVTFKAADIGQAQFGYNIANSAIIRVLGDAARATPGLTLSSALFEGLEQHPDHVAVTLEDGETLNARLVIGADGQNSRVRAAAGITHRAKPYPQAAITARLAHQKDHEDISLEFHTREGPFTFVPAGDHHSALVWIMQPAKAEAMMAPPRADIERAINRLSSHALGPVTIEGPMGCVPLQKLVADKLASGSIALIGEAAHAFPPIGAQGLNLGLQDVAALVDQLGPGALTEASLAAYARARKRDVETRSFGVDLLNSALIADRFGSDLARAIGLGVLRDIGPLRRVLMRLGGWSKPFAA